MSILYTILYIFILFFIHLAIAPAVAFSYVVFVKIGVPHRVIVERA